MNAKAIALSIAVLLVIVVASVLLWFFLNKDFSQVVLQRCKSYDTSRSPELKNRNCSKIVEVFKEAFVPTDCCGVTENSYKKLIQLTKQDIPCGQFLFWSNTKEQAHEYTRSKKTLFTLEDTLLGHLADGLKWCEKKSSSGQKTCTGNPVYEFWVAASKWFADKACGVVRVLLRGSSSKDSYPIYNSSSIFGRVEVPNLTTKVTELKVLVINVRGETPRDSCSDSSVKSLENTIRTKGIRFHCQSINRLADIII